jgi:hypothetical protein
MKNCPFCKEQVHDDAIKCRYCQSALVPGLSGASAEAKPLEAGKVTYVVDESLMRFGKFVVAVLGVFILVGTYLFGIKVELTVEKMGEAQRTLEKTEKDLEGLKSTAATVKKDVENARLETQALVREIEKNRSESVSILVEMRTRSLNSTEQAHLEQIRKRDPEKFRENSKNSKLWPPGTTLRVRFLDGDTDKKKKFENALGIWLLHANLRVTYSDAADAEVRVSFAQPGSWAFIGTDALAGKHDTPSINLGFEVPGPEGPRNYIHEIGHVLGLVHEFKNPQAKLSWDRSFMYRFLSGPPNFWDKTTVDRNYFDPEPYPGSRPFDPQSIMMMDLPSEFFTDRKSFKLPATLSEDDKRYIAALYP